MNDAVKKRSMCSDYQQEMVSEREKVKMADEIRYLGLAELVDFRNHPFKVERNAEFFELMQSIMPSWQKV